jgi:septum formation protein
MTVRSWPSVVADVSQPQIVLASSSPRRHQLLGQLGVRFEVRSPDIDETPVESEDPVEYVRRLARGKACAVEVGDGVVVIAADTTVDVDGEILGKPETDEATREMLRRISGRTHRVHTGIAVRVGDHVVDDVVTTLVMMAPISDAAAAWYIATGEPHDKAGAYALQGAGGVLVESVRGSTSNVVGLPLAPLVELCRRLGIDLLSS